MLVDQIERQQGMAQMVEHPEKKHEVESLAEESDIVDRELPELDLLAADFGGEARLGQIVRVGVDADDARGPATLHLDAVEARVAADVENRSSRQVRGNRVAKALPFDSRVIAEKMAGGGGHAAQVDVLKPLPERFDSAPDLVSVHGAARPLPAPAAPEEGREEGRLLSSAIASR